jgi:hypothetical protein
LSPAAAARLCAPINQSIDRSNQPQLTIIASSVQSSNQVIMPIGGALKIKGAALPTKDKCVRA